MDGYQRWEEPSFPPNPAALRMQNTDFELSPSWSRLDVDAPAVGVRYSAMLQQPSGHFRRLLSRNVHAVTVYCLVFWSFGICVGFLGPTLWDLGCQTGSTLPTMTWVFFAQSFFIMLGTMLAGLIINRFDAHPVLFFCSIIIALTLAAIPICNSIQSLAFVLAFMGFAMGILDTTSNVSMLSLFKEDVAPFLQALHFSYGFGGFLAPLIASPFLRNFDCSPLIDNSTSTTPIPQGHHHPWMPKSLTEAQSRIRVNHAFMILAALQIPVVLAILSLVTRRRLEAKSQPTSEQMNLDTVGKSDYQNLDAPGDGSPETRKGSFLENCWVKQSSSFIAIVALAALLLFFADGLQADFSGLVFSYGRLSIEGLGATEAAEMDATFWGTFAGGRLLGIVLSLYVTPAVLLGVDIGGCMGAMLLLVAVEGSKTGLYVVLILFGVSLSTILPITLALAENFVKIGPSATSLIVVGASTGEMAFPVVIGHLFEHFGAVAFVASGNLSTFLMFVVFILLMIAGLSRKRDSGMDKYIAWLPCCCGGASKTDENGQ